MGKHPRLRYGARDGFAHFVIVGSVAPRKVIYAHEFAWDAATDPAWPRLQKVFDFYGAKDSLRVAHGKGKVTGPGGPDNTHCNHIGAVHRKMIYPALKDWFGMPVPEEYSKPRPGSELKCWTDEARAELKPQSLNRVVGRLAEERAKEWGKRHDTFEKERAAWAKMLGDIEPNANPKVTEGKADDVPGGKLARFALEVEPGIVVPLVLISPNGAKGKTPVVVMVAQGGKAAFLKERADVIAAFLKAGVAVCLPDVRGTGETRAGTSADRGSTRTSISQTNLILGQPVLGAQLRDLRTVIRWLKARKDIDATNVALWGDSFAPTNSHEAKIAVPLDAAHSLTFSEPNGGALAGLAGAFETGIAGVHTRRELRDVWSLFESKYIYCPHEAVVPGVAATTGLLANRPATKWSHPVDGRNRDDSSSDFTPAQGAEWVLGTSRNNHAARRIGTSASAAGCSSFARGAVARAIPHPSSDAPNANQ